MIREANAAAPPLDTVLEVETPEQVRFRYQLAGPARRATAYVIDLLIRAAIVIVCVLALGLAGYAVGGASIGAMLLVIFAVEWGYYVLFESLWSGRTPGKRAMRLRVVREGGYPTNFLDTVLRNLLRAADFLPSLYAVGATVLALDPRFRRLGDMVAGTVVIVEDPARIGAAIQISPLPTAEEFAALPARPPLDAADLAALELFLRRLGTLHPARERELAEIVAPVYARRLGGHRYADPTRFLALLYLRAIGHTRLRPDQPQPQPQPPVAAAGPSSGGRRVRRPRR